MLDFRVKLQNAHPTGDASYFNYKKDDGSVIEDIAWYVPFSHLLILLSLWRETRLSIERTSTDSRFYPTPMKGAEQVAGRVAFYVGKVPELKVGVPSV